MCNSLLHATVETLLILHLFLVSFQIAVDVPVDARVCLVHQSFQDSLVSDCFGWQYNLKDQLKKLVLLLYFINVDLLNYL